MDENNVFNREILSIRNYKILYTDGYIPTPNEEWGYRDNIVKSINNAEVKYLVDLKCKVDWKEKGESINSISFLMPRDEAKLGDIFITSPYGLIKKKRTGVGATTLELKSPRNSIIVVPTKTLAYNKAKKSRIDGTNKYKVLYVGGAITGFKTPLIEEYLRDTDIIEKKFVVVADSLPKLLSIIGKENYKDYFFMVDEIDSYQYDSSYRPALEDVIDYYFEFSPTKRCLVSATVGEFSNKKIEEEPVINVTFNQPQPRNIKLLHTNNVIQTAIRKIKIITEQHPDDKILIAYNSVRRGILQIIESLDDSLKKDCAVLCSIRSKTYVENYYADIIDDKLAKKITFITCTYFVGIDISERFHLISISDSDYSHTLLSEDKLQQIAGRCRHNDGLLSEAIIYQTRNKVENKRFSKHSLINLKNKIIEDSSLLVGFTNTIPLLKITYPELSKNWLSRISINAIIENSLKSYYGTQKIKLIRKDIDGNFRPAYLNIDNILIQFELLNTIYRSKEDLAQSLLYDGNNIIELQDFIEDKERISEEIQEQINEQIMLVEQNEIENIIIQLKDIDTLKERARLADRLKMTSTNNCKTFIDRFLELQNYLPLEIIASKVPNIESKSKYNVFYNSVIFWAISEEHPLKIAFKEKLPLETRLTGDEIRERLNSILMSSLRFKELTSNNKAFSLLSIFLIKSDRIRSREKGNYYKIENYNVNDFKFPPLYTISANKDVSKLFKFSKDILT